MSFSSVGPKRPYHSLSGSSLDSDERLVARRIADYPVIRTLTETILIPIEQPHHVELSHLQEAERNYFNNLCLKLNQPLQSTETILWRIRCLKNLLITNDKIKKEVASRIAFTYTQEIEGVKNLEEASFYYRCASEDGCPQSIRNWVRIANGLGKLNECFPFVENYLDLPEDFFNSGCIPPRFLPKLDSEEKTELLKLLISIYQQTKRDVIIENRLIDLAAQIGLPSVRKSLKEAIVCAHCSELEYISKTDSNWRNYITSRIQNHSDSATLEHFNNPVNNPAMELYKNLNDVLRKEGFIFTKNRILKYVRVQIYSSLALSRFLCFASAKCSECSGKSINYSMGLLKEGSNNALAAWISVAFHQLNLHQLIEVDFNRFTTYALEGKLTDPRLIDPNSDLIPLPYPAVALPASASLPAWTDAGIEAPNLEIFKDKSSKEGL